MPAPTRRVSIRAIAAVTAACLILLGAPIAAHARDAGTGATGTGGDVPGLPGRSIPERASESVPGELLVQFEPGTSSADRAKARDRLGLTRVRAIPLAGYELVRTGDRSTALQVQADRVAANPGVRRAQPNHIWQASDTIPDDTDFGDLWGLHNTAQSGGTSDADIDAPEAWDVVPSHDDLVVAVIDTGVWADHPDLASAMWTNPGEIAGNDIDDDTNGFIDDVHGYDFANGDGSIYDAGDSHGTHVAGTIAATADNAAHVTGVSHAKVMALKFLGPFGGDTAEAIEAIDYAIDHGADVINASWGGGPLDQALKDKIAEAGAAGILFVAAAGNGGDDGIGDDNDLEPVYPASYDLDNIVAVAATTHTDGRAGFSNFGAASVDLGAPGQGIRSTVPSFDKAILTESTYHAAFHSFGLEGMLDSSDTTALLDAALGWAGVSTTDTVLVVDDDGGAGFESTYTDALDSLGYSLVTTHAVGTDGTCSGRNGPDDLTMAPNSAVIWFTGGTYGCEAGEADSHPTLTPADQDNLSAYLALGGTVLLFGQDIGFELTQNGAVENPFLRDDLNVDFVTDFDNNFRLLPQAGSPYSGLDEVHLDSFTAAHQFFSSGLAPRTGAVAGLTGTATEFYGGTSMAAPHVAGAAAVIHAAYPGLTHLEVKDRLLTKGDTRTSLEGKTVSGRRLNLVGSLDTAGAPAATPLTADNAIANWTQSEPAAVTATVRTAEMGGAVLRTDSLGNLAAGAQSWAWNGTDDLGATVPDGTYELKITMTDAKDNVGSNSVTFSFGDPAPSSPPAATAPDAPTRVTATAGNTSGKVSWKAPADDGGSAITSYTVTTYKSGAAVKSAKVSAPATSTTVTGLTNGTAYTFRVKATNVAGTGPLSAHSNTVTPFDPNRSGYWMLSAAGTVYAFGDAAHHGNAVLPSSSDDIEPTPTGNGYWVVGQAGFVSSFGDAVYHGGLNGAVQPGEVVTSLSATPTGTGYWLFTSLGRVIPFGAAPFHGDMAGVPLNGPVLDSVATTSGKGYYMVGSDGGIFAFGDAAFYGSMGGVPLNAPVQSLVPDADGTGYWLVAADGGIFAFESAFYGSMGGTPLNAPVNGMVAAGSAGYLMVASDGGIFAFGTAPFHGSLGANPPPSPIVAVAVLR